MVMIMAANTRFLTDINDDDDNDFCEFNTYKSSAKTSRRVMAISQHADVERKLMDNGILRRIFMEQATRCKIQVDSIDFYSCGGAHVLMYLSHGKVFSVDRKKYIEKTQRTKDCNVKILNENGMKIAVLSSKFRPQIFSEAISSVSQMFDKVLDFLNLTKKVYNGVKNPTFPLLMIDFIGMLIDMRDGYVTGSKIFSLMLKLFTGYHRFRDIFMKQTPDSLLDLAAGYAALGLPKHLLDAMKQVAALTGKRTLESDMLIEIAIQTADLLSGVIDFFQRMATDFLPTGVSGMLCGVLSYLGGGLRNYRLIKKVADRYTHFLRNEQAIFDPTYREEVMQLRKECIESNGFLEYVTNSGNRYFKTTWDNFDNNICKGVKIFDESRRDEPICFVFEGPPGSGKSAIMNNFVDLLRKSGLSVYTHSVPSAEDGKDFYDDYENQDVFVMDDVGQQGKSQWRYIINYVAPTKYPLPCAQANKKNTKSFSSKIIVCTTNHFKDLETFTSTDCISEPEALKRRVHLIDVRQYDAEGFAQRLTYFKFSHKEQRPEWKNAFLYHCQGIDMLTTCDTGEVQPQGRSKKALSWLYELYRKINACEERERACMIPQDSMFDEILADYESKKPEIFDDAQAFHPQGSPLSYGFRYYVHGFEIFSEWSAYYAKNIYDLIETFVGYVFTTVVALISGNASVVTIEVNAFPQVFRQYVPQSGLSVNVWAVLASVGVLGTLAGALYLKNKWELEANQTRQLRQDMDNAKEKIRKHFEGLPDRLVNYYCKQGTRLKSIAKFVKIIEVVDQCSRYMTHGVVSGTKILLPFHAEIGAESRINIYQTIDHLENHHMEAEKVTLCNSHAFPSVDLCVWEMKGVVPLYKKCKNLFAKTPFESNNLKLINSLGEIDVKMFYGLCPNKTEVSYEAYVIKRDDRGIPRRVNGMVTHEPWSGICTPVTGEGMCGTVLASEQDGIVAFHVAGDGTQGFMVTPSGHIAAMIREKMELGAESVFEIDDGLIPNFSGVRMRYDDGQVKTTQPLGDSSLIPTAFHVDYNADMSSLIETLKSGGVKLEVKKPPNFRFLGKPKDLLETMSRKTFQHQGYVSEEELCFIHEYIYGMLPDFNDVSDEITAFGTSDLDGCKLNAMNKDSSNGYGWENDKEVYFDFQNKEITVKGREMIDEFAQAAREGNFDPKFFMCRETFKDELRKESKVNEPRTFRVMPLPHIFWTKKLCAKLIPHFKKNMHKYGCCVGLNPYKDFSTIYQRLGACELTGDIDFAKWDGSVVEAIMEVIADTMLARYRGPNGQILDYVLKTMRRSVVLVGDAVYSTTHGLPSGTWLTLLLNCLINKSLTALTVFRNKANARPEDVHRIVDYVMGDDKIFGVPKDMINVFNLQTMAAVATSLGMTCTNGDKTPITEKSQPLDKLNFVKRHFTYHPALKRIVGKLELSTLVNTLQWMDATRDRSEVLEGKMRSVQVEAFLHGPGIYKAFMQLLEKYDFNKKLFEQKRIMDILNDEEGYIDVMQGLGKDVSFLRQ